MTRSTDHLHRHFGQMVLPKPTCTICPLSARVTPQWLITSVSVRLEGPSFIPRYRLIHFLIEVYITLSEQLGIQWRVDHEHVPQPVDSELPRSLLVYIREPSTDPATQSLWECPLATTYGSPLSGLLYCPPWGFGRA